MEKPTDRADVVRREHRILTEQEKAAVLAIKDKGDEFLLLLDGLGGSRELAIAKTKIEEAIMWGVKHVTR